MSGAQNVQPRAGVMGSLAELEKQMGLNGWDFFQQQFAPAVTQQNMRPADDVLIALAVMAGHQQGMLVIDWLLDLTCRAPYPVTGQSRDDLAFGAAKHQGRAAVGEVLVRAIAEGRQLLNQEPRT